MFKSVEAFGYAIESTTDPSAEVTITKLQDCLSSMDINPDDTTTVPIRAPMQVMASTSFASTSANTFDATPSSSSLTSGHRRTLRHRSDSSGSLLHGVNRRTISRPRKLSTTPGSTELSEKDIIKLYLNKKSPRVKSTGLETIFEETEDTTTDDSSVVTTLESQFKLVGIKKKRSLSFSADHSKACKTTVLKRRRRIKSRLGGGVKRGPKFSMQVFIEKMAALHSADDMLADCDSS